MMMIVTDLEKKMFVLAARISSPVKSLISTPEAPDQVVSSPILLAQFGFPAGEN